MYKRTGESAHYLPRRGSYSTVPHRNGRVDVLPPEMQQAITNAERLATALGALTDLQSQKLTFTVIDNERPASNSSEQSK